METPQLQKRTKSVLFWLGMVASVCEAVIGSLVSSGVDVPPVVGAVSVGLATLLLYCNGNNPSLTTY